MAQINKPNTYFNTVLWTGDGSNPRSITGVGFQPDLVWLKTRSLTGQAHQWVDVVRGYGTSAMNTIYSNQTVAEESDESNTGLTVAYGNIQSLNSDGFTVDSGISSSAQTNQSSATYASWNWKANGTGVSNTDGTITSTVSASTTSGFSIVSYTGNSSSATVGHGLGVAPKMIIIKHRNDVDDWTCYHASLGSSQRIQLNSTGAASALSWGGDPTSSVFYLLGGGATAVNVTGGTYIAYCFAEKKGFSKFGSYVGNGSTDGNFVYTGFKPAWVMVKNTSLAGESWVMLDNKRDPKNPTNLALFANLSNAEGGTYPFDFVSNGFKIRDSSASYNRSGDTFIYMAFAENPLVGTNNIPTTAR